MSAHTPLPWSVESDDDHYSVDDGVYIAGNPTGELGGNRHIALMLNTYADAPANAAHIVKCVNAHDDLVKALMAIVDADDAQELTNAHINLGHAALKKAGY